jgi:phenylpyruvate tautomerase PptA (4-oxalocrotonate tautomerase family)
MPLLKIVTSAETPREPQRSELLRAASSLLARQLGKPEAYVMTCLMPEASMTFAGNAEPSVYAELKNVGLFTPEHTRRLSAELCALLSKALGVPPSRIYLEFSNAEPHLWGFDGDTLA